MRLGTLPLPALPRGGMNERLFLDAPGSITDVPTLDRRRHRVAHAGGLGISLANHAERGGVLSLRRCGRQPNPLQVVGQLRFNHPRLFRRLRAAVVGQQARDNLAVVTAHHCQCLGLVQLPPTHHYEGEGRRRGREGRRTIPAVAGIPRVSAQVVVDVVKDHLTQLVCAGSLVFRQHRGHRCAVLRWQCLQHLRNAQLLTAGRREKKLRRYALYPLLESL